MSWIYVYDLRVVGMFLSLLDFIILLYSAKYGGAAATPHLKTVTAKIHLP